MRIRKFREPVGESHYRVRAWTNVQTGRKRVRVVIPMSPVSSPLRIFQRFRLIKFIEKLKSRVKNLKIEKIIAFDEYLHDLFFAIFFGSVKIYFLR